MPLSHSLNNVEKKIKKNKISAKSLVLKHGNKVDKRSQDENEVKATTLRKATFTHSFSHSNHFFKKILKIFILFD